MKGWRPSLRIARRTMLRNKARSALIALLIAVPIFAATFVIVTFQTGQVTGAKTWQSNFGKADALVSHDDISQEIPHELDVAQYDRNMAALIALLPPGTEYVQHPEIPASVSLSNGGHVTGIDRAVSADMNLPINEGIFALMSGRWPTGPHEIALAAHDLAVLGTTVGQRVTVEAQGWSDDPTPPKTVSREALIVGQIEAPLVFGDSSLYLQAVDGPIQPGEVSLPDSVGTASLRIKLPADLPWQEAFPAANQGGSALTAFVPYEGSELDSNVIEAIRQRSEDTEGGIALGFTALALCGLATGFIVGAAFAVGARRTQRDLALVGATGGSNRQLQLVVTSQGFALGVLGTIIGAAAGLLAFFAARDSLQDMLRVRLDGPLEFGWRLPALWLVGVMLSVIAAWIPARRIAAMSPLESLRGVTRRDVERPRYTKAAATILIIGTVGCVSSSDYFEPLPTNDWTGWQMGLDWNYLVGNGSGQAVLAIFFVMVLVGVAGLVPAFVSWLGKRCEGWGLVPRLAARNIARSRHRSAPAAAAILSISAVSVAGLLLAGGIDGGREIQYFPDTPPNLISSRILPPGALRSDLSTESAQLQKLESTVRSKNVHIAQVTDAEALDYCNPDPDAGMCETWPIYLADPELISAIGGPGTNLQAIRDHLAAGGIVTFRGDPDMFFPGAPEPQVGRMYAFENSLNPRTAERVELPVLTLEPATHTKLDGIVFASEVAVSRVPTGHADPLAHRDDRFAYFTLNTPLSTGQLAGMNAELAPFRMAVSGYEEFTPVATNWTPVVTALTMMLIAVTVALAGALADAEQRNDSRTMSAIGATPGLRRRIATAESTVIAGLGLIVGASVGTLIGIRALSSTHDPYPIAMPWMQLVAIVLAIPVIAWFAAWRGVGKE